jgi:tRNA dimethylallyltransferase
MDIGEPLAGDRRPLIAVVGPTAVGKTAVGIALAERIGGEIVSADAVAVYRGLDIGAAKPTREERARVPFHLIDVADPDQDFTVADFAALAEEAIAGIRARGCVPLIVGGTGLYVRAVTAILSIPHVPPQPEIRAALWAEAEEAGTPALHARLAAADPVSAARILPNDRKRIVRALEVWQVTGRPLSAFHTPEGVQGVPRPNTRVFGLRMARERLYRRIEERVKAMLAAGLIAEVRGLLAAGYGPEHKAMGSLGYRHAVAHLRAPGESVAAELARDTRRYAKRQMSWFNADKRVRWIDVDEMAPEEVARRIAEDIGPQEEIR